MYKIYADEELLCDSKIEELALIEPIVKLVANSAGSFTFTLPHNHPKKGLIQRRKTIISVYIDGESEPTFQGIATEETTDFFGQIKYECEGELTYFNDSIQRQASIQGLTSRQLLERYINVHNSQVEQSKRFTLGMVTVADSNNSVTCFTNYNTTMTEIKEDLIDDYGGYIRVRYADSKKYIDYLAESPRTNSQVIRLGENLLDYSSNIDDTEIATSILPLGKQLETQKVEGLDAYTTIESAAADTYHPAGKDYVVNNAAVQAYGWIQKVVKWDDVTIPSNLLAKAEAYLKDVQFENVVLKISAIDLAYLGSADSHFKILDQIRVVSEPHGMDRYFMLTEQTLNLNNPDKDTITLGKTEKLSLSARTAATNAELIKRIEIMPTANAVKSAINNATAQLTGAKGGYVVIERNTEGQPTEIRIQDAMEKPTKIWRWNVNGLGYSEDGGKTYGVAMTMDGSIVADYITSGTMTGDRVRGGTFEVGGTSLGKDGKILVKNSQNKTLITIDKNGIDFASGSGLPKSIKSTEMIFFLATTDSWPTKPTVKVTNTDTNAEDAWITRMPNYGSKDNYKRIFVCDQIQYTDDTYGWGTISEYAFNAGITKITKNTVTTAFVNALGITAKYISVKDLLATGISKIGGFLIGEHYIQAFNNTNHNDSTAYAEVGAYNPTYGDSGIAFALWKRANTSEKYQPYFTVRYDGKLFCKHADFQSGTIYVHDVWSQSSGGISLNGGTVIHDYLTVDASPTVYGSVNANGLNTRSGTGTGIYSDGDIYARGGIGCGGSKPRIVQTEHYGYRQMNAYETATPYFGDIGEGILDHDGVCLIRIDDVINETIDTSINYQVFIQKYGQGDIWVEERTPTYFKVKGTPNLQFGWELKAIQRDYEGVRCDMPTQRMLDLIEGGSK